MMILILKILSGISLVPFLFIFFVSALILLRLPQARLERYDGLSFDKVALVGRDGSVEPASKLIKKLKQRTLGLASATAVIIMSFFITFFHPETLKNPDMHWYLTFGLACVGGWLIAFGCMYYGNLVSWNLLGTKPPPGVSS
ncbi:hypothetical protein KKE19_02400 [Patescibacteria group bacterium]|nr:hypothetical protein [Patescibacteria group bacterium]MBU4274640.1 hypothetical protein [Patescibacteria group bacterium]MBU4367686.1 hypothetical protein [Patescibacteria group bacterium]MBU4461864.1 hypothetical protein [Patescibacteria group bacterium]MCG2700005.1 hypothetical protein [Candidatus Parcubacteria bacterium]